MNIKTRIASAEEGQKIIAAAFGFKAEKYGHKHEQQIKITNSLVENLIVADGLPLHIVETEYFRKCMADVHPRYTLPSKNYLTEKFVPSARKKWMF